jgi:geranylgeranyl diphosphate synthase type II
MDAVTRIERALSAALDRAGGAGGPPRLAKAMGHAVFPRGARVRPRLCLAVAGACGEDDQDATDAAVAAIELLHCASLVHDDLPCFDNADTRRGRPSVHRAFGEPLAVLAGDALIVLAFQTIARGGAASPRRLGTLLEVVGAAVGAPAGIAAGQAWECEPAGSVDLGHYQRSKTGILFAAAAMAGAESAGADGEPWRLVGARLGEAYQVADDIRDVAAEPEEMGKPAGRDLALGRPSAALSYGVMGAVARLEALAAEAMAAVPPCPGAADLRGLIRSEAKRLMPAGLAAQVAAA